MVRGGHEVAPVTAVHPEVRSITRKRELGAFYTPPAIAEKLVRWAVRSRDDTVLDPSFGALAFLDAAQRRLVDLGTGRHEAARQVFGVELDTDAFVSAARSYWVRGEAPRLIHGDFLDVVSGVLLPTVTAVVGNPPYLRYQGFNRRLTRTATSGERMVELSGLASSWAPFLVHAIQFVQPGGRLAHVVPAQLLHAQYAGPVQDLLSGGFGRVTVIAFEERVFPSAQEEVVLVCADDRGSGPASLEFRSSRNISGLNLDRLSKPRTKPTRRRGTEKLLAQLLPAPARRIYSSLERDSRVVRLGDIASVDIGTVTGANAFFVVPEQVAHQLDPSLFAPVVGRAAHIRSAVLSRADFRALRRSGEACRLLLVDVDGGLVSVEFSDYIRRGEAEGFHERNKCRERRPWWALKLPREPIPDLLLTYCAHQHPRLVLNEARVMHTNTLHGVVVKGDVSPAGAAAGFYNSLTMLSTELHARSYGGGVLKLEPTEAEALLVPARAALNELEDLLPAVDQAIRAGDLDRALDVVDEVILEEGLGLMRAQVEALRHGAARLRARRLARARVARAE